MFRNSCSLERNCLITASKNLENINVQLLNSFGDCPVYSFPYGWKPQPFLPKCGLYHQSGIICQCRMSEESKRFKKWRIWRSRKLRPRKLRPRKLRPRKLIPLIFFKGKLCFRFFHNSFNLERITRWLRVKIPKISWPDKCSAVSASVQSTSFRRARKPKLE